MDKGKYITPSELAERWGCSRSSVDRVIKREGMSRMFLGEGQNGMVRLIFSEIEAFEEKRTTK